jgi:hypothetical protein
LLSRQAASQNAPPSGNLYGSVHDEQDRTLPGVTVTLQGPAAPQTASTDSNGDFHFLELAPGTYSAAFERAGFAPVRRDPILISLGKNTVLSLTMGLAAIPEAMTVSGDSPVADSRKTETGSTFGREELQGIPTSRDPWNVLQQVPGVLLDNVNVGGSQSAFEPVFVGKGSHSDQNSWVLDGVAITDMASPGFLPIFFDFDSLEEIHAVTGGSDLSLQTPGVTINLVTKRGTNRLQGSARFFYVSDRWQSGSEPQEAKNEGLQTDRIDFVRDYGLELGGPILKDRIWLWGAADQNDTSLNRTAIVLANGQTVREKPALRIWTAKLNAQISNENSLTLFYQHGNKTFDARGAAPDRPPETTIDLTAPTSLFKMEDAHVFSAHLLASAYYSYLGNRFSDTPEGGIDKQVRLDAEGVWHNSYAFYSTRRPQHQAGVTASAFLDTGQIGHELKFGFGYKHTVTDSLSSWPGEQIVADEFDGLAWLTREENARYEMNYIDTYLGDTMTIGALTVNAGVRFDYQQGRNRPSNVAANPVFPDVLPAVQYPGDAGYPITWRNFEPRLSATYAVGGEKKTLLRASYSRFANQLGPEVLRTNAFPGIGYLYYGWQDANGDHLVEKGEVDLSDFEGSNRVDPDNPGASASVNRIASNLKAPTTDEIIVGVDRQLAPDFSVSLAYTYRSARNLEVFPLVGTDARSFSLLGDATGTAIGANGFVLDFREPYYGLTLSPPPVGVQVSNRPDYRETYSGLEIQVFKRLSHGWMLRGSFAYSDWRRHLGSSAIVDPNNRVGGSDEDGGSVAEPSGGATPKVFVNSRWQFNVSGLYQFPLGFQVGANFFGRQGFVLPYFVAVRGVAASQPLLLQVGRVDDYRLGNVYELDLRLEKAFRIASSLTITPSIECFNALDRTTVLRRDLNVGTYDAKRQLFLPRPLFNTITQTQSPRILRAGLRVSF